MVKFQGSAAQSKLESSILTVVLFSACTVL